MKLDIIFHYDVNEITGEIKFVGKDEITVDTKTTTKKKSSTSNKDNNPNPIITLDTNKLIFTQGAIDMLEVCDDCRIDVKYNKDGRPIIGTDKSFGTKGGNLLTQKLTVSYRGAANTKLSTFGTTFTLEPTKDTGIFFLIGDKEPQVVDVPDELINIEEELDMTSLDSISEELSEFDFTL